MKIYQIHFYSIKEEKPVWRPANYEKENDIKRLASFVLISIKGFCVESVIKK